MTDPKQDSRGEAISRGMQKAREDGKHVGRPRSSKDDQIAALLSAGWPAERVRKHLKVGTTAVQRVRHKMKER